MINLCYHTEYVAGLFISNIYVQNMNVNLSVDLWLFNDT